MRLAFTMRYFFVLVLLVGGCAEPEPRTARDILDTAIEAHGGPALDRVDVRFQFRDRTFRLQRFDGLFRYERWFADSTGATIHDVLTNDGLTRDIDGERIVLDPAAQASAETGVNSVAYFALLPYPLADPAVQTRLLGETLVRGEAYWKIEVTFAVEGGGRDYEDRFVYWVHQKAYTMDYLAYYYHTNDTGSRFREAVNRRSLGGFLWADYLNYTAVDSLGMEDIGRYDALFESGRLDLVSEVRLDGLSVERIDGLAN